MSSSFKNIPEMGSPSWKEPVANQAVLPSSNNGIGDARVTIDTNSIWLWGDDATWHEVSGGSGGGIESINGDTTAAQLISSGIGISVNTSSGNTTVEQIIIPERDSGTSGTTKTITFSVNSVAQLLTLDDDCTVTLAGGDSGGAYLLRIIQDSTPRTITWTNAQWPGGTPPVISTGSGAVDLINFYFDGTNYYGNFSQNFS